MSEWILGKQTVELFVDAATLPEGAKLTTDDFDKYGSANVVCLDCGWKGFDSQLAAQACPVCDGRCADC